MSEGTPGRGPDAEPRTDNGEGQAPANGRPAVPPVRYGPRNPASSNGRGAAGRTVPGTGSPQQYRSPQPSAAPANGANGSGANGSGANGAHAATPGSYPQPRPNGSGKRPEPTEQERLVADARTAAAARNASASRARSGSTLPGRTTPTEPKPSLRTSDAAAAGDETAVIPVVTPAGDPASAETTSAPEKTRGRFDRLRDRRSTKAPQEPGAAVQTPAEAPTVETPKAEVVTTADTRDKADDRPGAEPEPTTEERTLTWRDRLGLSPKTPKPQSDDVPEPGPDVPAAAAATAVAAPTVPTPTPTPTTFTDRVTPTSPVTPTSGPDTAIIPAVEAAPLATAAPAQSLVTAKPKVGAARRTRKARLRLSRVDPWSVMKTALLFSIAAGIILVVATYGVWSVLNASGLFDAVDDMVKSVVSTPGDTTPFRIEEYVNTQKIIGVAALIAVVDVLIFTALATLGSFLYNLAATVLGGLEVTLAED